MRDRLPLRHGDPGAPMVGGSRGRWRLPTSASRSTEDGIWEWARHEARYGWCGLESWRREHERGALPTIAVLLIGYGALSGRLLSTVITQAMVFVALGLLVGNRALGLVDADTANQYVRLLAEATLALVLFTDAALGLPVVTNKRLPSRIRQGLNVESGLNDGVCVPLLIIFLTLAQAEEGVGHIEPFRVVLEEIGFGVVGGSPPAPWGPGSCARARPRGGWRGPGSRSTPWPPRCWPTPWPLRWAGAGSSPPSQPGSSAVLLGPAFAELDWRVVLYAVASLTVVRMLPVALAMLGTGMRRVTVGFLGWFGPRGLASGEPETNGCAECWIRTIQELRLAHYRSRRDLWGARRCVARLARASRYAGTLGTGPGRSRP
jgi:hypothetical protein